MAQRYVRHRHREYGFALKHVKPFKVLDVGCCESHLGFLLVACNLEVYGCDVRRCYPKYEQKPFRFALGSFTFLHRDIRTLNLPSNSFDTVLNISTLEHIGLIAYDQKVKDELGDLKAMRNIRRLLKPNGVLIFTGPYGKGGLSWMRVYNDARLAKLFEGFKVEVEEYWLRKKKDLDWRLISKAEARETQSDNNSGCTVLIKAVKA